MTFDKQSNGCRTAVESKSNRNCNHRLKLSGQRVRQTDGRTEERRHIETQTVGLQSSEAELDAVTPMASATAATATELIDV